MLKSLDVVIGLTVVLLALSMAVTVITQAITTVINSRGRHLRRGLTDLLQQLDPALTETLSKAVATEILTHPLVSGSGAPFTALGRLIGGARLGNVVHREEFTKLLMAAAAGQGSERLSPAAVEALTKALSNNGVVDPRETLKNTTRLIRNTEDLQWQFSRQLEMLDDAEGTASSEVADATPPVEGRRDRPQPGFEPGILRF